LFQLGGSAVSQSFGAYLKKYGMRCPGEIDITKPRWSEKPIALIPVILSNIKNFEPNLSRVIFEKGLKEARHKEEDILRRLQELPGGKGKAKKTKKMISVLRNFTGFREYPKYSFIRRFQIYKDALMREADVLVKKGIILNREDVYYLSLKNLEMLFKQTRLIIAS